MEISLELALETIFERPETAMIYIAVVETPDLYQRMLQIIAGTAGSPCPLHEAGTGIYKFFRSEYNPVRDYEIYDDLLNLALLRVEWLKLAQIFSISLKAERERA